MKTVLRGGPFDGRIVETTRSQFGFSEVREVYKKVPGGPDQLESFQEIYYGCAYRYEKHPCKKKGTTRVYEYNPVSHGMRCDIKKYLTARDGLDPLFFPQGLIDKWLDTPHDVFDKKTPRSVIVEGKVDSVRKYITIAA